MIDITFKNLLTKEWSEIYILNQFSSGDNQIPQVPLTWGELPSSCTAFKNQRKLLTSGIIFAVNKYECFMEYKNTTRPFYGCKPSKIESRQNFISFYKQRVEALNERQDSQNIKS